MEIDEDIRKAEDRLAGLRSEHVIAGAAERAQLDASIKKTETALAYLHALRDEMSRNGSELMTQPDVMKSQWGEEAA
ncbi:MAG TPA: hypothetical protein VMT99_04245 [Candidatus Paceibacterota bacterium]|nr:hypothetical protein [Candidatus Paceibacterota bacterium]